MSDFISIPSFLTGFRQRCDKIKRIIARSGRINNILAGEYPLEGEHRICPKCKGRGHKHDSRETALLHLPSGSELNTVVFNRARLMCQECSFTWMQSVPFKAENHFITTQLETYTYELLELGLTLRMAAELTGPGRNTVKEIDKKRLENLYTHINEEGRRVLLKPERQTKAIAVDEFKLHEGHVYATIVIDLEVLSYALPLQHPCLPSWRITLLPDWLTAGRDKYSESGLDLNHASFSSRQRSIRSQDASCFHLPHR